MAYKMDCPICSTEIETTRYSSEWGTEEEYYHCNNCGYGYEFAYGNYREHINGKEFVYSYATQKEELTDMRLEYDMLLNEYKIRKGINNGS